MFDGGEAERWICIRSQWKGDGEEKSIWQDEENDEEDEEEENKEKDENDNTERDEVENIEVVVEEEMEETRYDMWGKRELLTEEEAKRKGVNVNNRRPILIIVPTTLIGNWKNEFEKWRRGYRRRRKLGRHSRGCTREQQRSGVRRH